jgi:hypothetical protein
MKPLCEMEKEEFKRIYKTLKDEGFTEREICSKLYTNQHALTAYKMVWKVDTIKTRKNKSGVREEHFRKGALIGLDRRLILRRVRDGMHVSQAISLPRQTKHINKGLKNK